MCNNIYIFRVKVLAEISRPTAGHRDVPRGPGPQVVVCSRDSRSRRHALPNQPSVPRRVGHPQLVVRPRGKNNPLAALVSVVKRQAARSNAPVASEPGRQTSTCRSPRYHGGLTRTSADRRNKHGGKRGTGNRLRTRGGTRRKPVQLLVLHVPTTEHEGLYKVVC